MVFSFYDWTFDPNANIIEYSIECIAASDWKNESKRNVNGSFNHFEKFSQFSFFSFVPLCAHRIHFRFFGQFPIKQSENESTGSEYRFANVSSHCTVERAKRFIRIAAAKGSRPWMCTADRPMANRVSGMELNIFCSPLFSVWVFVSGPMQIPISVVYREFSSLWRSLQSRSKYSHSEYTHIIIYSMVFSTCRCW